MARRPVPTRAWVEGQIINFLAAISGRPRTSFRPQVRLSELGLVGSSLAAGLNEQPALNARGLRLTRSDTARAATVGDLVSVVLRKLPEPTAPPKAWRAKAVRSKSRKRAPPPKKAAKKTARKVARKAAPKRKATKRTLIGGSGYPRFAAPGGGSFGTRGRVGMVGSGSSVRGRATPSRAKAKKKVMKKAVPKRADPAIRIVDQKLLSFDTPPSGFGHPFEFARPEPRRVHTVRARPPAARPPPLREPRYANAALLDPVADRRLDAAKSLRRGQMTRLRLDIGERSSDSQVVNPQPIDDNLPSIDLDLDVMVSSTDFTIGADKSKLADVAHGGFFLPGDGSAATARGGGKHLVFFLKAPDKISADGQLHARIGFYYKNILVQSQQLIAHVGAPGGFSFETDYTLSADLTGMEAIPERPRISIFTNANGDGGHQIVLRHPGQPPSGADKGSTIHIGDSVDATIETLRQKLTMLAPPQKLRGKYQLIEDLRELVPLGRSLYSQLPGKLPAWTFHELSKNPEKFIVQVARPTSSSFVLPWAFLYDIPLNSNAIPTICPMVEKWDGSADLFKGSPRQCPNGPHKSDVLCPFGFWGFRYAVEQVSRTDTPTLEIPVQSSAAFVAGEARYGFDVGQLDAHIARLRTTVQKFLPQTSFSEGQDRATLQKLLGQDLPFVYFFCHGQTVNVADRNTWLSVGNEEKITADDFISWTQIWSIEGKRIWDKIRPLVFINACHSLEIASSTLVSYLDAFVGNGSAAGVIGTEVKVEQGLAMDLAEQFFAAWLPGDVTVESALREIRMDFLRKGNLFGLVYTPYCWSELKVVKQ